MDRLQWWAYRISEGCRRVAIVLRCLWLERTHRTTALTVNWPPLGGPFVRGDSLLIESERVLLLRIRPLGRTARLTVIREAAAG